MLNQEVEQRFKNTAQSKTFNNIVRMFDLDKKSVLDIGCSFGEFVACFGKESTGITIVEDEVAYGIARGLDIRYGNIEADDFVLDQKYDVIFANNIFEHLYSPHHFLCKIKGYLKPGGMVILGVPCIPKIISLLRLKKFRGSLASVHINFFTRETLVKTVERAGWKPMTVRGFHFSHKILDRLLDPIYPHFYVVATIDPSFAYPEKRMKELLGYAILRT